MPARTEVEPGEESFVTIFARDENGNPFGAGENIQLAATLGDIQVNGREVTTVTTDSQGRAVFTFVAGEVPGTAKITAFLRNSDAVTQDITIRDVEDDFTVAFDRTEVANGEKVTITVVVFNGAGRPARGILVTFSVSGASGTLNAGVADHFAGRCRLQLVHPERHLDRDLLRHHGDGRPPPALHQKDRDPPVGPEPFIGSLSAAKRPARGASCLCTS